MQMRMIYQRIKRSSSLIGAVLLTVCASVAAGEGPDPATLTSIGGHWYVGTGDRPVYYFKDADRYVDLFSYHRQDSNKDGIENVKIHHDDRALIIDSQGYPNHPTAIFPNSGNPNRILVQQFQFRLPLKPELADQTTRVPMGPIGVALNGVVFFNPFEQGGMNAVAGYSEVWLDSCCGHPQQTGVYHYHKYPVCVKSPFKDDGKQHSPIIGFAFDGFPIYGPYESDGVMAKDLSGSSSLDVCNGHSDEQRGYHYHVTPGKFPYVIGGYAGVPERTNIRGPRSGQVGAIADNASGESKQGKEIGTVQPGNAARGGKHSIQITLIPENARRGIPDGVPTWVQVGPFEASEIQREGNIVTAVIAIPEDAPVGVLLDCHLEFTAAAGRPPVVCKKNDVFRVVAATEE